MQLIYCDLQGLNFPVNGSDDFNSFINLNHHDLRGAYALQEEMFQCTVFFDVVSEVGTRVCVF